MSLDRPEGEVSSLRDVGDVNGDRLRDVEIVWSFRNQEEIVILFGSRRLGAWRSVGNALKAGAAKRQVRMRVLPRDQLGSPVGAYTRIGQAQIASTRDDGVEVHYPCTDGACHRSYTASRLVITNDGSGKVRFAYGEDWGDNGPDLFVPPDYLRFSSAASVRRFGYGGRAVVLFCSPNGGARIFGWIHGHMGQMKLGISVGKTDCYEVPTLITDMNGDGIDEIVGVGVRSANRRALGIVIIERRRN